MLEVFNLQLNYTFINFCKVVTVTLASSQGPVPIPLSIRVSFEHSSYLRWGRSSGIRQLFLQPGREELVCRAVKGGDLAFGVGDRMFQGVTRQGRGFLAVR